MLMQLIGVRLIPIEIVSLGVAIGSLVSVVMVFRAEIEIQPASPNTAMMLKEVLETFKYVPSHSSNAGEVYTQDLPRMLRWDEGNVTLEKNEKGFILNGGVTILMLIRKELTSPRKK
jgi:hypothetical protein